MLSAEAVRALLAAELGGSPDEVFAEFDPEPLAAASVAQVYRAKLRSGEDVVVKVQRPGVREQAERDIAIVRRVLALDRGDPAGLRDGLLEIVDRTEDVDEQRLERALGALVARHFGPGRTPDLALFTGLFRVVADFRLSMPPPVAAVFRALATVEGTLTALAPGFDVVAESRAFAVEQVGARLRPASPHRTAVNELTALLPVLRRIPRRVDRIGAALEEGRLSVNVRLFSDERDRDVVTGLVHEVLPAFVGAATGLMAVFLLTGSGGPRLAAELTLHHVFGYNLLVISALVGLRLLFVVFRRSGRRSLR